METVESFVKKMAAELQIDEEKAHQAFQLSLAFVKARVGNAVHVKIDNAVTGEPEPTFNDKIEDFAEEAADTFEKVKEAAGKKFEEFKKRFTS
ncbi:MAG: hypothetical protein KatS3mg033_1859 [Thermonema sp.]|jgi:ribosomal protein L21E|uniref:hypothetical protein n=1 Tax=Thermonema TaxID=28194 RepID=UPI000570BC84|nr:MULTISPECIES: hypothetical protein [Thermonema]GIV40059.1 MAG: hypothetical protein KatS3mg033_1859 [Thermonema sp.]